MSAGHAPRPADRAETPEALARKVVGQGLNVRQTERLVQEAKAPRQVPAKKGPRRRVAKDADTLALERDLSALLGLEGEHQAAAAAAS